MCANFLLIPSEADKNNSTWYIWVLASLFFLSVPFPFRLIFKAHLWKCEVLEGKLSFWQFEGGTKASGAYSRYFMRMAWKSRHPSPSKEGLSNRISEEEISVCCRPPNPNELHEAPADLSIQQLFHPLAEKQRGSWPLLTSGLYS